MHRFTVSKMDLAVKIGYFIINGYFVNSFTRNIFIF